MLGIEHDPVEPGAGDDFDRQGAGQVAPDADLTATGLDGALEAVVFGHG